ncbi:macro domain-containing protein CT2219-like [Battus philenor]|uniref:macro domain-containing protein CT2219-like n=1 Tax=Battus philenor TaxID=42288 RepID=UPI0035CFDCCA
MLSPVFRCSQFCKNIFQFNKSVTDNNLYRTYSITKMTTHSKWKIEKNRILNLPLEEKRKLYRTSEYIILDRIYTWLQHARENEHIKTKIRTQDDLNEWKKFKINPEKNVSLAEKVSIFKGDITKLEIDAIVNAANSRLKAGGGVDGAIHRAAGPLLQDECNTLGGCLTGEAKVTCGYDLPAKYVIHTVGPQDGSAVKLQSCYESCLALKGECHYKSIAFPCISTGIYGFPNRQAAHIALRTVRKFLESNEDMERVIFCTFMPVDVDIYETLMQLYFPIED